MAGDGFCLGAVKRKGVQTDEVKRAAHECGFELVGVARAEPLEEVVWYREWLAAGMAGEMAYLGGRGAELRADPRSLLASARSVICVGKLYNTAHPQSGSLTDPERGWVSRYAWGQDYHTVVRAGLELLLEKLRSLVGRPFEARICTDAEPLLERSLARRAGLGWSGRNTCLINQWQGSWFVLGELVVSLDLEPDAPAAERCGSCKRCIEACPTGALIPTGRAGGPGWTLEARRCISYLTIELRGAIPEALRPALGHHVFGCDICQEVCPWNRKAAISGEGAFQPSHYAPRLAELVAMSGAEFRQRFAGSPLARARRRGLRRNAAVAMGNSAWSGHRPWLERMARDADAVVAEHARWALERIEAACR